MVNQRRVGADYSGSACSCDESLSSLGFGASHAWRGEHANEQYGARPTQCAQAYSNERPFPISSAPPHGWGKGMSNEGRDIGWPVARASGAVMGMPLVVLVGPASGLASPSGGNRGAWDIDSPSTLSTASSLKRHCPGPTGARLSGVVFHIGARFARKPEVMRLISRMPPNSPPMGGRDMRPCYAFAR